MNFLVNEYLYNGVTTGTRDTCQLYVSALRDTATVAHTHTNTRTHDFFVPSRDVLKIAKGLLHTLE